MLSFFSPKKKLEKKIAKLYTKAMEFQRNGKLREYGELTEEIKKLEEQLQSL